MDIITSMISDVFFKVIDAFDSAMNVVSFIAAVLAFIALAVVIIGIGGLFTWSFIVDVLPYLYSIVTQ